MLSMDALDVLSQLWKIWSIQGSMILSLAMQLILALTAPLRKKTSNSAFNSIVWLAYFLADWIPIFAFGLISNAECKKSSIDGTKDLLALWASFLLIHLGGPDTITAFSLEDNALWIRYLVGLIAHVFAFLYIFIKMLPGKTLMAPTLLVFATGFIKYGERIRALYLASLKNFKDTSIKFQDKGSLVPSTELRADHGGLPEEGLHFFDIFKSLIVDIMPSHSQRLESREVFLKKEAELAFEMIAIELNLLYEVFYTKIIAAYSSWGFFLRNFAYFMSIAALILFFSIKKDGLKPADVHITYALLAGVIALDTTTEVMLATSNWKSRKWKILAKQIVCRCIIPFLITALMYDIVIRLLIVCGFKSIVERSWSSKMGSFNLLAYGLEKGRPRKRCTLSQCCHAIFDYIHKITGVELQKIKEEIDKMRYTKKISMDDGIWKHTFDILHERASRAHEADQVKEIYEARGELALQDTSDVLKRYVTEFEYDHSVLLWHVATEICYNMDTNKKEDDKNVKFSKILSDYMMYLMVKQPDMMSAVADIFHERYRDTRRELKQIGAKTLKEFCLAVSERYYVANEPDHQDGKVGAYVLVDSCSLAKILGETEGKWEIICKVWVELLLYAAGHCRAISHAKQVVKLSESKNTAKLTALTVKMGDRDYFYIQNHTVKSYAYGKCRVFLFSSPLSHLRQAIEPFTFFPKCDKMFETM